MSDNMELKEMPSTTSTTGSSVQINETTLKKDEAGVEDLQLVEETNPQQEVAGCGENETSMLAIQFQPQVEAGGLDNDIPDPLEEAKPIPASNRYQNLVNLCQGYILLLLIQKFPACSSKILCKC